MKTPTPLKRVRLSLGLSQVEVANGIRSYQTRISRLESGSLPTEDEVIALSDILRTSPEIIFLKLPKS
jgi:predicted transcriptional regulator